jgi:very-short-patch-repair endonuclease
MAAVLAGGPDALLSHGDAVALWGLLPAGGRALVHVSVPTDAGIRQRAGLRIHRAATLTERDAAEVDAIPVTAPARTLVDVAATAPREALRAAVHEAEVRGLLDLRALEPLLTRPGGPALRAVLGLGVDDRPRSELERRFLALIRRAGLPTPEVNVQVLGWVADFVWPSARLIVEVDGGRHHATRAAFGHDRDRDARHAAGGYVTLRFTWAQVTTEAALVLAAIRAHL